MLYPARATGNDGKRNINGTAAIRGRRDFACLLLPPLSQRIEKTEPVKDEKFFPARIDDREKGSRKNFFTASRRWRVLD